MSIEEKIKTAKEDSWLKDSVSEKEFKEIKDNERRMTNEEAIKLLNEMIEYGWLISDLDKCEAIDALEMAIEALSTESENVGEMSEKQTDGDLISRQEAIECCFDVQNIGYKEIAEAIKKLPTYSAEQTYGWCKGCKEYDTEKHCCHRYSSFIRESLQDSINAVLEDIKAEIDKFPRIKAGNSNSPTVKYCIDERLLYEILEKMKGE